MSLTDQRLLRDYTERRSEAAFAELVRRHVDLVYSVAVRMVRDAHLAEDVTQRVFVALARRARRLTDRPVLAGWLHRTARNIAAETVRADVRRRAREQEAAAMIDLLAAEPDVLWGHIAPHLDTAMTELSEADREAVLLRYFQRKSAREMAQSLGVSEDAAQKRVSRAVERLRQLFSKRGIGVGAGGLTVVLVGKAVQAAPAGLASGISSTAFAATAGGAGASLGLLKWLTMTKLQAAVVGGIVVGAVLTFTMMEQKPRRRANESLRQRIVQQQTRNPAMSSQAVLSRAALKPPPTIWRNAASPATKPSQGTSPYQEVADFLASHRKLPRRQIEAYLRQNGRSVESLLAAYRVSRDPAYLREAATNAPEDPAVQFAVIVNHVYPNERRQWIDVFKASSPDNALPWYFAAWDDFQSHRPEQAIRELAQATRRKFDAGYAAQSGQAIEAMYRLAGWPALAAKASTDVSISLSPYFVLLKTLGNETVHVQTQYLSQSDTDSAAAIASMGVVLGNQLRKASAPIAQLVGIAIEKKILAQLNPTANYAFLHGSVGEAQAALDRQKESIREAIEIRDKVRPTLDADELNNYWEREMTNGEISALGWLKLKYQQP